MNSRPDTYIIRLLRHVAVLAVLMTLGVASAMAQHLPVKRQHPAEADSIAALRPDSVGVVLGEAEIGAAQVDSILAAEAASMRNPAPKKPSAYDVWEEREYTFNPDPTRAVWLSALFPGLGQVYNRRYWKLPLIIGGYLGLGYATNWNNGMLKDYTVAYRDIMDSDPTTNSYMNFFPPTTSEANLDKTWLTNLLQSRKNFYRRNRDLCIISMVGVYLLAMVDAYVDASLSHFDISPDLAVDVAPGVFIQARGERPSLGLIWAFTF